MPHRSPRVDSGILSGILTISGLESVDLWREAVSSAREEFHSIDEDVLRYRSISFMISSLTRNLILSSHGLLGKCGARTPDEGRTTRRECISVDGEMQG